MAPEAANLEESEVLAVVRECLDLLAAGQFDDAFERFGYALAYQYPSISGGAAIQQAIQEGRPDSRVTDWRTATASEAAYEFVRYAPNDTGIVGAISIDLPLDGTFREVAADFVIGLRNGKYLVSLEHIYANPTEEA